MRENRPIIKLRKDSNCWTAVFVSGLLMIQYFAEFGTNEIPTSFTEKAFHCEVLRAIRRLNPDCKVIFA